MYKYLALMGCAGLLAACSSTSSDGRLTISNPDVITEYRDANNPNVYYGCDTLVAEGNPEPTRRKTQVRVSVQSSGALSALNVRLDGLTADTTEGAFTTNINASNTANFRAEGNNRYSVVFTADSSQEGQFLPYSSGRVRPLGITVEPTIQNIKLVRVDPQFRVNRDAPGGGGRFIAYVQGVSDQGATTADVPTVRNIAVYSQCTLVEQTDEPLL